MAIEIELPIVDDPSGSTDSALSYDSIEADLHAFEAAERRRLGLITTPLSQWVDSNPTTFSRSERDTTTILVGGLTVAHDVFIQAALEGIGYRIEVLPCPDTTALHFGKEFGNRAQCNPTYFTVGNLLKRLIELRDTHGLSVQQICDQYIFLTAGACGPCRFGTYATEYRKALRDAGFGDFRVVLFQQQGGLKQATGDGDSLEFNLRFFMQIIRAILAGDVLNALGYRVRPYEVQAGQTDEVIEKCREIIGSALRNRRSLIRALTRCKVLFSTINVNRLQPKPKVTIIGEFWAMTTEGEGNYRLQSFLESEGAEVDIQLVTSWLLYMIWQNRHDVKRRANLGGTDFASKGLAGRNANWSLWRLWAAERTLRLVFRTYARAIGLVKYELPNMEQIADLARDYYDVEVRGGEGHMEVGKLIESVSKQKAHMVISVKPFGCMPSSGVSDGIQSAVVSKLPDAIYCPVETTGDGEVNFQCRILMYLFKAHRRAKEEFARAHKQ